MALPVGNEVTVAADVSDRPARQLGAAKIQDGLVNNLATVSQFHNIDNQQPGAAAFGILTGGVAQLLNAAGNLDRQRETGIDNIPALGIMTGAAQFAMSFLTTDTVDNFAAGARTFTPVSMSGTINTIPWSIQVGSVLVLDSGANAETVVVTAVTATTFSCVTTKAHNGTVTPFSVAGFVYNQERDAAGELDGATGAGTAIAAEYEFNSGGPSTGGNAFDRARNVQGKGRTTTTVVSGLTVAGVSSFVVASAAGIVPGIPLYLERTGANAEVVYVARNYVSGTTIPLASPTVLTHANGVNVEFDAYAGPIGPGLNGFLPTGVGIEEEALFDPVSGLYFIERASTQDGVSGQNVVLESPALWNGATMDRARSVQGQADAVAGVGMEAVGGWVFNGVTWDRQREGATLGSVLSDVSDRTGRLLGKAALWDGGSSANVAVNLPNALEGLGTGAVAALASNAVAVFFDGTALRLARTPSVFKTVSLTAAGSNAVWTPAVGKKFRLMAYIIEVTENASLAVGAINTFSWLDAAGAIGLAHSDFEPTTAVTTGLVGYTTGLILLGNGYLSTLANNVLNLSIGTALATGVVRVNVWGTEE